MSPHAVLHTHSRYPGVIDSHALSSIYNIVYFNPGYCTISYSTIPVPFTVWTRIKCAAQATGGEIISKRSYYATSQNDFPFFLSLNSSGVLSTGVDSGNDYSTDLTVTADAAISYNIWHFVGVRWDGSHLTLTIDSTHKTGTQSVSICQGSRSWKLGFPSAENGDGVGKLNYRGYMHGFGLYTVSKSDAQMDTIRGGYLDPTNASVLYDFSEGSGTTLTDLTGNSRNGALNGASATWTTGAPFA